MKLEGDEMLYIRLFHGRTNPNQDMDDWGFDGPVLGPYQFAHTTYVSHVKLGRSDGNCDELHIHEDMLYYDDCYRFIADAQTLKQHYRELATGLIWKGAN